MTLRVFKYRCIHGLCMVPNEWKKCPISTLEKTIVKVVQKYFKRYRAINGESMQLLGARVRLRDYGSFIRFYKSEDTTYNGTQFRQEIKNL